MRDQETLKTPSFPIQFSANFDVFLISESKLDSSFPDAQFFIPEYRIFRKDRNANGGGLFFYVNEDIPCKK